MGLISRVSSRTYRSVQSHYLRRQNGPIYTSSICPYQGAPGQRPAQVPYQREQPSSQELAAKRSSALVGTFSMGLLWLWLIRIPNAEQVNAYIKHVDLDERYEAMKKYGVFAHKSLHADWQKANIAKLQGGEEE